jgi:lysophospholipase L1-like esterase
VKRTATQRIALIGDSIRLGYEPLVREKLKGHKFVSPKENCGDSMDLLENFNRWFRSSRAGLYHVNVGLHDVRFGRTALHHQGSASEYEANLGELVSRFREISGAKFVWALTTPVIEERHDRTHPEFTRSDAEIQQYNTIARTVMTASGIPVHDLYEVVMQGGPERLLSEDGVHFTPEGYRVLAESVTGFLVPLLN